MKKLSTPIKYLILAVVIAILPLFIGLPKPVMTLLNTVVIYCIIALGYNILLGYAGQISLGHAAFMGLGAYLSVFLTAKLELPFLASLALAGLIPMVIGALLGLVALRLEGQYLAIATLGFGVTIQQVFKEWTAFTNGYSGVRASYPEIFGLVIKSREHYFVMSVVIFTLLSIFAYNMLKTKTGRALIAMRDSEHAAQAMGISLFKYKLIAFSISAFYAGIAGSLYAHLIRFVEPTMWGMDLSLNLLAMVVIGGLSSIGGSIVGASFITLVPEIVKNIPVLDHLKNSSYIITGISMILVILFLPLGLSRITVQLKPMFSKIKGIFPKRIAKGGEL